MKSSRGFLAVVMVAAVAGASVAGAPDAGYLPISPPVGCLGQDRCAEPTTADPQAGLAAAKQVFDQFQAMPEQEKRYFREQIRDARGFAIFPDVQKRGLMFGGSMFGRGLMAYRDDDGKWSPPILLTIDGNSMGPQFGVQSSTYLFIFKTICGVKDFLSGHHHLSSSGLGTTVEHVGDTGPSEPLGITVHVFEHGMMMGQSYDRYAIHLDEEANAALFGVALKPGCLVEGVRYGLQRPWVQRFMERISNPTDQAHEIYELLNQPTPGAPR